MVIFENNWGTRARGNQREIKINGRVVQKEPRGGRNHTLEVGPFSSVGWRKQKTQVWGFTGKRWQKQSERALVREQLQMSAPGWPQEQKQCSATPPHPLLSPQGSGHCSAHSRAFFLYSKSRARCSLESRCAPGLFSWSTRFP